MLSAGISCVCPGIRPVSAMRQVISAWMTASGATGSAEVASVYSWFSSALAVLYLALMS
jgi:hypothetical protein